MTHPYAAPCAQGGYCTEKGMSEPGFCKCKERVERIANLEHALLEMREIALACCRASDVDRINEIAKAAFAKPETGG